MLKVWADPVTGFAWAQQDGLYRVRLRFVNERRAYARGTILDGRRGTETQIPFADFNRLCRAAAAKYREELAKNSRSKRAIQLPLGL